MGDQAAGHRPGDVRVRQRLRVLEDPGTVQEVAVMDEVSDLRDHLLAAELLPADD